MFGTFGWMELMLVLIIVLIIFGAGKIPQLGEGLGKAIKGFKKSVHEADAIDVTPQPDVQEHHAQAADAPGDPQQSVHAAPSNGKQEQVGATSHPEQARQG